MVGIDSLEVNVNTYEMVGHKKFTIQVYFKGSIHVLFLNHHIRHHWVLTQQGIPEHQ